MKIINDPIHGYMEFEDWAVQIIDTPQFQRLREIKQLGTACFIFPGANHNRFEHSLGTAHLAYTFTKRLQQQSNEISEADLKCVTLAALCHDLGHGPFSHVFEKVSSGLGIQDDEGKVWKHEKGSVMMFDQLIKELGELDLESGFRLETEDKKFIKALITGKSNEMPKCLFNIVNNKDNSVDVDKFDYLGRDCYYLGMKSLFEFSRLMRFSRIMDGQIVYNHKECFNIYEMFHTRYSLHKKVYNHRVSRAIDHMVIDALMKADSYYDIKNAIKEPTEYIKLNDSILSTIEHSKCEELEESRNIVKRIRRRDLYRFVAECLVPKELKDRISKEALEKFFSRKGDNLSNNVIVEELRLNYGKGDQNPVDDVKFYNKEKHNEASPIPRTEISYLVPEQYEEVTMRVFSRESNK
ncbi:10603_t:CDS:10, partial [Dentiscutata erythropus]